MRIATAVIPIMTLTIFVAVVFLALLAGCSTDTHYTYEHDHDHSDEPSREVAREYLRENYPTRDQMLRVRQCVTERTGYEYPELPDDFGPEYLTKEPPAEEPRPPDEVYETHFDCVFHLGLKDRFVPPWDQDELRPSDV